MRVRGRKAGEGGKVSRRSKEAGKEAGRRHRHRHCHPDPLGGKGEVYLKSTGGIFSGLSAGVSCTMPGLPAIFPALPGASSPGRSARARCMSLCSLARQHPATPLRRRTSCKFTVLVLG